mmetsp:Transcript_24733/g.42091  ORF Transcript_24733/g.42091 Transcript_24733/m.42091 type:complete len:108 (-) Transcript_24733:532-855(-)
MTSALRWGVGRTLRQAWSRSFSSERPFRILGLQQIAVGSLEKEPLRHLWQDVLGLEKAGSFQSKSENVDEDILFLGGQPGSPTSIEVDIMTPLDPEKSPKVSRGTIC